MKQQARLTYAVVCQSGCGDLLTTDILTNVLNRAAVHREQRTHVTRVVVTAQATTARGEE